MAKRDNGPMAAGHDHGPPPTRLRSWGWLSWGVALAVLVGKVLAWWTARPDTLMADAVESAVDIFAATALVVVLGISRRPPDAGHPWGHAKAEYFSAGFHGALTVASGIAVLIYALSSAVVPPEASRLSTAAVYSLAAVLLNLGLSVALLRAARRHDSPALEADARHNLADVWTTVGAWLGLGLASATGWWVLDPIIAGLVGLHIVRAGYGVLRSAVDGLMDASLPGQELERIGAIIREHMEGALEFHDLRARKASDQTFIEFHLVVAGTQSVERAHALCDRIEDALESAFSPASVHIHVEPDSHAETAAA